MKPIAEIAALSPVIPVVALDAPQDAVPLAEALLAGGIRVIEVTLRTPQALQAAAAIARSGLDIALGIGSILDHRQLAAARDAGAQFVVTPGTPPALAQALAQLEKADGIPALPGAATASEMLALRGLGFTHLKFFPAEAAGGVAYLKALAGPMPDLRFCPTGGIDLEKAKAYLALNSVPCLGGSWLAPEAMIRARDWAGIAARCADALQALRGA